MSHDEAGKLQEAVSLLEREVLTRLEVWARFDPAHHSSVEALRLLLNHAKQSLAHNQYRLE